MTVLERSSRNILSEKDETFVISRFDDNVVYYKRTYPFREVKNKPHIFLQIQKIGKDFFTTFPMKKLFYDGRVTGLLYEQNSFFGDLM